MNHLFVITHVELLCGSSSFVNTLPNIQSWDLVFITQSREDETESFGVLTELVNN